MTPEQEHDAPKGFKVFGDTEGMFGLVGPVFGRIVDGEAHLGFRVAEKHLNPSGSCHGGMLATLVDVQVAFGATVALKLRKFLPTINLNCDFLVPVMVGEWVEGRTEVIRATPRMVFCNATLNVNDTPVLRANGIMKIPRDRDDRFTMRREQLPLSG
ncbi:MAG: PaaI family thioesterase [Minwuia sp.]|nr:PaaI family thioesterase [Minwuia sp.]